MAPEGPTESRDRHLFGPGPKRILALDGGGVRGAISTAFLERIEELLCARQGSDFGGVSIEHLQAFEAAGVKLIVDVFGEVAVHICLADAQAGRPFPRDGMKICRL